MGLRMPEASKPKRNYEVGRGKPPKRTQFKPGQSGNPSGRRKKPKGINELIADELKRQIEVQEDGQRKRMSVLQAFVKRLVRGALKMEPKALAVLLSKMPEVMTALTPPTPLTGNMSAEEAATAWAEMLKGDDKS